MYRETHTNTHKNVPIQIINTFPKIRFIKLSYEQLNEGNHCAV